MSEWINIVLPTQTFQLPRDFILAEMPQSIFAEALRENPLTTQVIVTNPAITPETMQYFVDWSQGKRHLFNIPRPVEPQVHLPSPVYQPPPPALLSEEEEEEPEENVILQKYRQAQRTPGPIYFDYGTEAEPIFYLDPT